MKIRHFFSKTPEFVPVLETEWHFYPWAIYSQYPDLMPKVITSTVIPGNALGSTQGSYSLLSGLAVHNYNYVLQETRGYPVPQVSKITKIYNALEDDYLDNHSLDNYKYEGVLDFMHIIISEGTTECLSTAYVVDEDDDYICVYAVERYVMVVAPYTTLYGPRTNTDYEEIENFGQGSRVFIKNKAGKSYYCKKDFNLITSNVCGHEMFAKDLKLVFNKDIYSVKYKKSNGAWSAYNKVNKKVTTGFSNKFIVETLHRINGAAVNKFYSLVLEHLNQVTGKNNIMPSLKSMLQEVVYLRRFRRNIHNYPFGLVSNIPLSIVDKKLSTIGKKFNIPRSRIETFGGGTSFHVMAIAGILGHSFNLNYGLLNISTKFSADNFIKLEAVIGMIYITCSQGESGPEINYSNDIVDDYMTLSKVQNKYVLHLVQKQVIQCIEAYKICNKKPKYNLPFEEFIGERIEEILTYKWNDQLKQLEEMWVYGYPEYDFRTMTQSIFHLVRDTDRMLTSIINAGYADLLETNKTLEDFHNQLTRIYHRIRKENLSIPNADKYFAETTKYLIRKPATTHDVVFVGEKMNICVGSYTDMIMSNACEIVVVYQKDNMFPVACIEIKNKQIIQSKLSYNEKTKLNQEINGLIADWATTNKLTVKTSDIL